MGVGRGPAAGVLSDDRDHPLDRPEDRAVDHHLRPPALRIGAAAGAKKKYAEGHVGPVMKRVGRGADCARLLAEEKIAFAFDPRADRLLRCVEGATYCRVLRGAVG